MRQIALIFLVLGLISCGGSGNNSQLPGQQLTPRILNGIEVNPAEMTSAVFIRSHYLSGDVDHCSGVVIAADAVLTAGHCFAPGLIRIEIITHLETVVGTGIIKAPGYREDFELGVIFDDLAIVKTPELSGVAAMPLVVSAPVPAGTQFATYGYGLNNLGDFGKLHGGLSTLALVTPNHLFTEEFTSTTSNTCNGDSGAPAVGSVTREDGVAVGGLLGIVSTGTKLDCSFGDVTLYTNLTSPHLVSFILEHVPTAPLA